MSVDCTPRAPSAAGGDVDILIGVNIGDFTIKNEAAGGDVDILNSVNVGGFTIKN